MFILPILSQNWLSRSWMRTAKSSESRSTRHDPFPHMKKMIIHTLQPLLQQQLPQRLPQLLLQQLQPLLPIGRDFT